MIHFSGQKQEKDNEMTKKDIMVQAQKRMW